MATIGFGCLNTWMFKNFRNDIGNAYLRRKLTDNRIRIRSHWAILHKTEIEMKCFNAIIM